MSTGTFIKYFIIFNILLAIGPVLMEQNNGVNTLIPYFWRIFAIFAGINLLIYVIGATMSRTSQPVLGLLGGISLKFLLTMIIAFVYLRLTPVKSGVFLLDFFYLYLFNSVFEIYCLLRNLRNQN